MYELAEKLDEAEAELERKEDLMKEMMEIINSLEEAQMIAEAEGGKNSDEYLDLKEEHEDLKKILEEKMIEEKNKAAMTPSPNREAEDENKEKEQ